MRILQIVTEKHHEGFTTYPLGIRGAIVGQGMTRTEALADVESAIRFHIETFGPDILGTDGEVSEAYIEHIEIRL